MAAASRIPTLALRALAVLAAVLLVPALSGPAAAAKRSVSAYTDEQLAHGFYKTVFGVEHGSRRYGRMVKKYAGPVRFSVINRSAVDRRAAVRGFIADLPSKVRGLKTALVSDPARADFTVIVVDRASYVKTVRADVLGSHVGRVPGSCLVKVDMGADGIARSTAVVVSDEGESLFRRCMTEEILQGLGPMNDDRSLADSVFNDATDHDRFMPFDRAILSMLYHPAVRHGMSQAEVREVLPQVIADIRRRLR
jgi:hypothetical protein